MRTGDPGWPQFDKAQKIIQEFSTPIDSLKSGNDETIKARLEIWEKEYNQEEPKVTPF